jgi:hypothetical protein
MVTARNIRVRIGCQGRIFAFVGQVGNLRTDCQSVHPGKARTS